jgi:hypothetical protein
VVTAKWVMTPIFDFLRSLWRTFFRLAVLVLAGLLVLGLLFIGALAALLTALWFMLTGRRPTIVSTFMRFRQAAQPFRQGAWSPRGAHPHPSGVEVVDVQAREVRSGERQAGPSLKGD